MSGSMGSWWFVLLTLAGCLRLDSTNCANGGICPSGLRCATVGAQDFCVLETCGNGNVDVGELCDDGNNLPNDECPLNCTSPCGDGFQDSTEACDDGNIVGGDGCSADCRSRETCGGGVADPGEECDDANFQNHDGCTSRCTLERPVWIAFDGGPSPRLRHAAAFDTTRNVLVMFSGSDGSSVTVNDTWEWDGVWRQRAPRTSPPGRILAAMAYDPVRQRIVMIGGGVGGDDNTWEWDGIDWTANETAIHPAGPVAGIVYDAARGRTIALVDDISETDQTMRMWSWDGVGWEELHPARMPPPRAYASMTYDATRSEVVLFGGGNPLGPEVFGDTWTWNGTDWTQRPSGPPARAEAAAAFDEARGVMIIAGGRGFITKLDDVWEWDGGSWQPGAPLPEDRQGASLVYEPASRRVLLFGGRQFASGAVGGTIGLRGDIWSYDGARWARIAVSVNETTFEPTSRSGHGVFVDAGGHLVTYGGQGLNDTWKLESGSWYVNEDRQPGLAAFFASAAMGPSWLICNASLAGTPPAAETWHYADGRWSQITGDSPPLTSPMMTYDPIRDRVVLFGGLALQTTNPQDQTWEWSVSTGWVEQHPATRPPPRVRSAMAFDPIRRTILLFDGQNLWEWNGADWVLVPTQDPQPSFRLNAAFVTDPSRNRVVLFGGADAESVFAETWEWDGVRWTQRSPVHSPPPTEQLAGAFDVTTNRIVVFGGFTPLANGASIETDEIWEWNGLDWQRREVTHVRPSARSSHAAAYDVDRRETVVFGGQDATLGASSDTWIWSHSGWRQHRGEVHPSPRRNASMAYDPISKRIVLYGGNTPTGNDLGDTWEWDGTRWQELAPAPTPKARSGHAMVFDGTRQTVMLIGGRPTSGQWEWNGTTWSPVAGLSTPPSMPALAYDQLRNRVVAFGGIDSSEQILNTLLEWDGSTWQDRTTSGGPIRRFGAAMVFDPARRKVVMSGGYGDAGPLDDSWEWDGTRWTRIDVPGPTARAFSSLSIDPVSASVMMFGGMLGDRDTSETWLLRSEDPAYRDEVCVAGGGDLDFDGLSGCDDPDCSELCAP